MRRAARLFDFIVEPDNLALAYAKACRGKRETQAVRAFALNLDSNLAVLRDRLLQAHVTWGPYVFFTIHDPKERIISAARFEERVLQHAIMNVLDPVFERHAIHHSYACRKGKGTQRAVLRAFDWTRSRSHFLKLDVRKYFDSIDHSLLSALLRRLVKDERVLALFDGLLASYETAPGRGLPIGNLTSQYFANHYLSVLDHFVLEKLGTGAYVRYMDDFVLWHDGREALQSAGAEIRSFLRGELGLSLKLAAMGKCAQGLPFLGFLLRPEGIYLQRKTKIRMAARARTISRDLETGRISEELAACKALSVNASVLIARSWGFRARIWGRERPRAHSASSAAVAGTTMPPTAPCPIGTITNLTTGTRT